MKKNRTAQFMIQRLGTSKVWTQRKFIPNEHFKTQEYVEEINRI